MSLVEDYPSGWSSTSEEEEIGWSSTDVEEKWSSTDVEVKWSSTDVEVKWSSTDVEDENGLLNMSASDSISVDHETVLAKPFTARNVQHFIASEFSSGKTLRAKALSILSIKSVLKETCKCGNKCIKKLSVETVRELRKSYWESSQSGRLQILIYYVKHSSKLGKFRYISVSPKLSLCSGAFIKCLKISSNKLSCAFEAHRRNELSTPGRNSRPVQENSLVLMTWIENYATMHGDRMPNSNQILLPNGIVKNDLYQKYKDQASAKPVSRAQFYSVWKQHFPHVIVKKTERKVAEHRESFKKAIQ